MEQEERGEEVAEKEMRKQIKLVHKIKRFKSNER